MAGHTVRGTGFFLGKLETIVKTVTKNKSTDFLGTKRVEELKWFSMIGAVTNDAGFKQAAGNDGSPVLHQHAELSAHETIPLVVNAQGYL
jgi:hypothetical protein